MAEMTLNELKVVIAEILDEAKRKSRKSSKRSSKSDHHKRGPHIEAYGIHTDGKRTPPDLVDKRSAWDVIELIVQKIRSSGEDL